MKRIELTEKECDMLDQFIAYWIDAHIVSKDLTYTTYRGNRYTAGEIINLQRRVQQAYFSKDINK